MESYSCADPGTKFKHANLAELKTLQVELVRTSLINDYHLSESECQAALSRFLPSALKHGAEMLLLAARKELREVLGTPDALGRWRHPVEDQDQLTPPRFMIEDLFKEKERKKIPRYDSSECRPGESLRHQYDSLPKR